MTKKKFKFNIIDAIVIVVILALLAFGAYKLFIAPNKSDANETVTYRVTYFCDEVPEFAINALQVGAPITDEDAKLNLGTVTAFQAGESVIYTTDAEGNMHAVPKPGHSSVALESTVTVAKDQTDFSYGMKIGPSTFGVGHTLVFRAGKVKLYGRISGIEIVE